MIEAWAAVDAALASEGDLMAVEIDGTDVALGFLAGTLVAFDETCTHRGCPLSDGVLAMGSITCPCHMSRFDIHTGAPIGGPATEPIRIRQVRQEGGRVYVER